MAKKDKSKQHEIFFSVLASLNISQPQVEYMFHPTRKWRMDYAWPEQKIALEVEGGIFIQGRHSRGAGMKADFEKYNEAAVMGWRIIKCTPSDLCKSKTILMLKQYILTNQ